MLRREVPFVTAVVVTSLIVIITAVVVSLKKTLVVLESLGYLDGNPSLNGFRWGTTNERMHLGPPKGDGTLTRPSVERPLAVDHFDNYETSFRFHATNRSGDARGLSEKSVG